jgi:hypothetical protein
VELDVVDSGTGVVVSSISSEAQEVIKIKASKVISFFLIAYKNTTILIY